MSKRLNVLWICTDSQRQDTLGCYGNSFVHTPNIDKLALEGIVFENCFAQNPLCTPSRGGFLTGRYPVTNGLRQNGQNIKSTEILATKLLADNGYHCGLSGKLHVSACNRRFELAKEYPEWWKRPPEEQLVHGEPRIDDGYTEFFWDHAPNPLSHASSYTKWLNEKDAGFKVSSRDDSRFVRNGMPEELHQTTFCVEKAIDFLQDHNNKDYPWLFSVNIFDPHFQLDPPEKYLQRYLEKLEDIPLPNYIEGELDDKPFYQLERHEIAEYGYADEGNDPHEHRMAKAAYWAMCDLIDVQVGRLLEALEKSGQKENTLVVFTSDHGEMLGDHGLYIKGPFLYDPAIQVPLIISLPGVIVADQRSTVLVELNDLAPTVLDAAEVERHPGMQARSFWPLLCGEGNLNDFREDVYCEYYNSNTDKPKTYLTMLRDHKYKIVVAHGMNTGELYDLSNDTDENINLWDNQEYEKIKAGLVLKLMDRMAFTCDPLKERIGIF